MNTLYYYAAPLWSEDNLEKRILQKEIVLTKYETSRLGLIESVHENAITLTPPKTSSNGILLSIRTHYS